MQVSSRSIRWNKLSIRDFQINKKAWFVRIFIFLWNVFTVSCIFILRQGNSNFLYATDKSRRIEKSLIWTVRLLLYNGRYTNCFSEKQLHSLTAIVGREFETNSFLNLPVYDEGTKMRCLSISLTRPHFFNFGFRSIQV